MYTGVIGGGRKCEAWEGGGIKDMSRESRGFQCFPGAARSQDGREAADRASRTRAEWEPSASASPRSGLIGPEGSGRPPRGCSGGKAFGSRPPLLEMHKGEAVNYSP